MSTNRPLPDPTICALLAPSRREGVENDDAWCEWSASESGATQLRILKERRQNPSVRLTVEEAKSIVRPMLDPAGFNETRSRGPVYMRQWFAPQPMGYGRSAERLRGIIDNANQNPDYWEAASLIAARLLREGAPLGEGLRLWLAERMEGVRKPPKRKPGKRPYVNVGRDLHVRAAITVLSGLGMQPTRNAASATRTSGCDVVAEVLVEFKRALSYEAIAKIWNDRVR